jgi:hypothetical protein
MRPYLPTCGKEGDTEERNGGSDVDNEDDYIGDVVGDMDDE